MRNAESLILTGWHCEEVSRFELICDGRYKETDQLCQLTKDEERLVGTIDDESDGKISVLTRRAQ
jgi:hypothetical protein